MARYKWQPLCRAAGVTSEANIQEQMRLNGATREAIMTMLEREAAETELWINDIYQVALRRLPDDVVHLNIRRRDGGPIMRDWRHFQRIKNELVGEECEAIELYPAESRLSDTGNKFHLFAVADPAFRFPFGNIFGNKRDVSFESGNTPGTRQRPA